MSRETLTGLHTALIDAREGYEKAIEVAEDSDVKSMMKKMSALHHAAHAKVHEGLAAKGEAADDGGSFMGNVHKAAISLRSAVTGIDEASMASFASGEERILNKYDDAIREEGDTDLSRTLAALRDRLAHAVSELKGMAANHR